MTDVKTKTFDYQAGDTICEGYLAWSKEAAEAGERRPGIVVCHAWAGPGDHERESARKLAELGYVALCADVYGKGVRGSMTADNSALMAPFLGDRKLLVERLGAAVQTLGAQPTVDSSSLGAIGYCFGGLCVLDMARANLDVKGVVSFHGVFPPNGLGQTDPIASKILLCHGWEDALATPEAVVAVASELTERKADWQLHAYGHAVHGFTHKGPPYDATADRRSWAAMEYHLKECLR